VIDLFGVLVSVWRNRTPASIPSASSDQRHGVESSADSVHVTVDLDAPAVTFMKDTTLFINDTLVLRARGTDKTAVSSNIYGHWTAFIYRDTTFDDTMMTVWPAARPEKRTLKVKSSTTTRSVFTGLNDRKRQYRHAVHQTAGIPLFLYTTLSS